MSDFLICSFPRSRTLWLTHYLGVPGRSIVTHEACEFAGSAKEFWSNADALRADTEWTYGNCDSANIFVLPALLAERPMTKVVWINRNLPDVCRSLKKVGMSMDEKAARLMLDLRDRYCCLFDMVILYEDLNHEYIAELLWSYILPDIPFDILRFRKYNAQRICYDQNNPMPKKDTRLFVDWVNQELRQPVET